MTESKARPSILWGLIFLLVTIAAGAHLSAIPLFVAKIFVAVVLVAFYAFFTVRIVGGMQIGSTGTRAFIGVGIACLTVYATWALRIPAFSGWETPFTADPKALLDAIVERASSMRVTKAFGHGTSTEGPSWLMLGTYVFEAIAFLGIMTLGAMLAGPAPKKTADETPEEAARHAA